MTVRYALAGVGAAAAAALVVLVAAVALPAVFGHRSLVVMSGSMEPAIATGDVVVVRPVAPISLRPGDVATFTDPGNPGRLITHRVLDVKAGKGLVTVESKGDANVSSEQWSVAESGRVGLVRHRIPGAGFVLHWLRGNAGRLVVLVLPALGLGLLELSRIWDVRWRRRRLPPGGWRM